MKDGYYYWMINTIDMTTQITAMIRQKEVEAELNKWQSYLDTVWL